jgi:hypothetical protein
MRWALHARNATSAATSGDTAHTARQGGGGAAAHKMLEMAGMSFDCLLSP